MLAACSGEGGGEQGQAQSTGKPVVYVVNYPLQYFAERIAGDFTEVVFPAPADGDPAFWEPKPEEIAAYQSADLILLNGAGYAKWVPKASLPQSRVVDTSILFKQDLIEIEDAVTHTHGPGGEHEHTGTAFTTWLDLAFAAGHVHGVTQAMAQRWPERRMAFEGAANLLITELKALDEGIGSMVTGDHQPIVASHPVYQYLARRYGMNIQSVMWEPDVVPDDNQWHALEKLLESHPARWMMWEAAPNPESVQRLDALGVKSIVFDPCGNRPAAGEDFMSVMRANAAALRGIYGD